MFIALDLETTGFDAQKDQIIEIAAIKFEGDKVIDTFETLLNPHIPIPPMVSHITGIHDRDVVDAPNVEDVREKFIRFLGDDPIVGHNIPFDVTFLQQQGFPLKNVLYDTLILAGILFPNLPSYSLDTLTRLLKIEHTQKHRAMSDTHASFELFLKLQKKIAEIPEHAREEIRELLQAAFWPLKELFLLEHKVHPASNNTSAEISRVEEAHSEQSLSQQAPTRLAENFKPFAGVEAFDFHNFYDQKGPLAEIIQDYESRPTQTKMSELILDAFRKNKNILIEAGTGTGKTLAYLLSSALWSFEKKEKVVISTYTHTLQQQILEKDIPVALKVLQKIDANLALRVAVLKGRKNYLSRQRFLNFKKKSALDFEEIAFVLKIILWLEQSQTGDLSELHLQNKEKVLVEEICCHEDFCLHTDLDYQEGCYLLRARSFAEQADLIIVNHALLLQNEVSQTPLLPEYHNLIIDEAHQLEGVLTETFTITLSLSFFLKPLARLERLFLPFPQVLPNIQQLAGRVEIFFGLIGIFLEKEIEGARFDYSLNLGLSHFQSHGWQKIAEAAQIIFELGVETLELLNTTREKSHSADQEMQATISDAKNRFMDLKKALLDHPEKNITWLMKTMEGSIHLKSAPLQVGTYAHELLFTKMKSVVLTSATLTTNGNFQYLRDQLQLGERVTGSLSGSADGTGDSPSDQPSLRTFEEYVLPSHFRYPEQVKIIIAEDLPEPATEGYFLSCCDVIKAVIKKNQGRTLVLFTSKKALAATYHRIAPELKTAGFSVLGQNISGGRGKILEHFKDEPEHSAIFGTSSFWEGVDMKGDLLTCVVMQKLPFDPPDDPIISARSKKYANAFEEYQIPRAILRFKQGFGRLIRSSKDTGSIVILDTRILQKSYGPRFLSSLPEGIQIVYQGKDKVAEAL